jgi:hypothetical protein
MEFEVIAVNSTAIRLLAYCETKRILRIIFNSGTGYDYYCSRNIFEKLAEAESVGQAFWNRIKKANLTHFKKLTNKECMDFICQFLSATKNHKIIVEVK